MSGIYIPGMGMPQRDEVITIYPDGTAHRHHLGLRLRISESKSIPVPDHGRLGDLDELKECLKKPVTMDANRAERLWEGWHECTIGVGQAIDALPTIIPEDKEGEG